MKGLLLLITTIILIISCTNSQSDEDKKPDLGTRLDCCNHIINHLNPNDFEYLIDSLEQLEQQAVQEPVYFLNTKDVISVLVNINGDILIRAEMISDLEELRKRVEKMYNNPDDYEAYATVEEVDVNGKTIRKSKGLISIKKDRLLPKKKYLKILKILFEIVHQHRNEAALELFDKNIYNLTEEEYSTFSDVFNECPISLIHSNNTPPPPPPPPLPNSLKRG